jgi:hypothetical protein
MEPDDLLCSRNARPPKALVGRAQWKLTQPPSLKRERASLEGLSVTSLDGRRRTDRGALPKGTTSKLGRSIYISVAARCMKEAGATQAALRARRTPTIKRWSFDARNQGQA